VSVAAVRGFPPVAAPHARVLVLGSLPGARSLQLQQYYGLPRNVFWRIMSAVTGVDAAADYAARVAGLQRCGVALWDVIAAARRQGSLDAAIDRSSLVVNDFATFFAAHPRIGSVCCNGATAAALYRRLVLPTLPAPVAALPLQTLPSTSPAHAALSFDTKQARWLEALLGAQSP
jgi:double-stranded uracil-DNA glycosylase